MNEKASDSNQGGSVYHLDSSDPLGELIDRSQVSPQDIAEINRIMAAMAALRQAEEKLSEASLRYMKLNRTDMRALHFLIVAEGFNVPPGEVYHAIEASKGELGVYMKSNGGPKPERVHFRGPSFVNLSALPDMVKGEMVADVVAVIGSLDIVLGEIDR